MFWVAVVFFICWFVLPFPIASLYSHLKGMNKFMVITPLMMFAVQMVGLYFLASHTQSVYESVRFFHYLACCFVAMIIGTVGLYYGVLKPSYHYGGEMGMNVWRCFVYCFTMVICPPITAGIWSYIVYHTAEPTEKVRAKRPELGKRPSWKEVVEEKEDEGGE